MTEPDVVVMGAGAAGVGAACGLVEAGLSVMLLEALPRVGGRGWTQMAAGLALDMGCGWLHSGDRNPWTAIAEAQGKTVDRRTSAWGEQFRDLGFPPAEQAAAHASFERWSERVRSSPPASDGAADAIEPGDRWRAYLDALSGYISGDELTRISARDYAAYDRASSDCNWRVPTGYGALIAGSLPSGAAIRLSAPVRKVAIDRSGVLLDTDAGSLSARAVIVTVSTHVLAGDAIGWPAALDPWREAARCVPLGANEKLFLAIDGDGPFEPETHLIGDPHDPATASFYIRPLGSPVIECFLGGLGARRAEAMGRDAAFAHAIDQLVSLFGASARRHLRPLAGSDWAATPSIGGGYSHALPGEAHARALLARPFEDRLFFAGEATHATDFSTAHGAYQSGLRAAGEAVAALTRRRAR